MNKHYIVLNGKRYDAVTGALLDSSPVNSLHTPQPSPKNRTESQPLRDGTTVKAAHPKPVTKKTKARPQPTHIAPHKPQGGKTLMRRAVKRPVGNDFLTLKRQYPAEHKADVSLATSAKTSVKAIDPARLNRAKRIHKSSSIGRFISQAVSPIRPSVAPISVATPPTHAHVPAQPTPKPVQHPVRKQDIFEQALANAKSHETKYHPPKNHKRRKALKITAAVTSVVLVGGLLFTISRHSLELQVASVRAGFSATAPTYVPNGYTKDATAVEGKSVSINYVSQEDQTKYTLTQEPSDWNSQTLLSTIVARTSGTYRALQHSGRTIYIYEGNKAAWVDGGILYTIAGSAPLTTDQITSIAASL